MDIKNSSSEISTSVRPTRCFIAERGLNSKCPARSTLFFPPFRACLSAALVADIGEFEVVGIDIEPRLRPQVLREVPQKDVLELPAASTDQMVVPQSAVVAIPL